MYYKVATIIFTNIRLCPDYTIFLGGKTVLNSEIELLNKGIILLVADFKHVIQ